MLGSLGWDLTTRSGPPRALFQKTSHPIFIFYRISISHCPHLLWLSNPKVVDPPPLYWLRPIRHMTNTCKDAVDPVNPEIQKHNGAVTAPPPKGRGLLTRSQGWQKTTKAFCRLWGKKNCHQRFVQPKKGAKDLLVIFLHIYGMYFT